TLSSLTFFVACAPNADHSTQHNLVKDSIGAIAIAKQLCPYKLEAGEQWFAHRHGNYWWTWIGDRDQEPACGFIGVRISTLDGNSDNRSSSPFGGNNEPCVVSTCENGSHQYPN
ncbi:MAG: hypothetical protein J0H10_00055, partial [Alphaproteobacteria bacterium]|nr:hypothetical protein [Alphaproteobacteria bacterium]